jgi:hypothetical protein
LITNETINDQNVDLVTMTTYLMICYLYDCLCFQAKGHSFKAHSSHVTNVDNKCDTYISGTLAGVNCNQRKTYTISMERLVPYRTNSLFTYKHINPAVHPD